ncbi:MAG: HNH endonuclease [Filifactoraceae bacterium]
MLKKFCRRCQAEIDYGKQLCEACEAKSNRYLSSKGKEHLQARQRKYQDNRTDKEYQAIYISVAWKTARKRALSKSNFLCEDCIKKGRVTPAIDVHHIKPLKDGGKAFELSNLKCLCRACHRKAHETLDEEKNR